MNNINSSHNTNAQRPRQSAGTSSATTNYYQSLPKSLSREAIALKYYFETEENKEKSFTSQDIKALEELLVYLQHDGSKQAILDKVTNQLNILKSSSINSPCSSSTPQNQRITTTPKFRKFVAQLQTEGYKHLRTHGSHQMYQDSEGHFINLQPDRNGHVKLRQLQQYYAIHLETQRSIINDSNRPRSSSLIEAVALPLSTNLPNDDALGVPELVVSNQEVEPVETLEHTYNLPNQGVGYQVGTPSTSTQSSEQSEDEVTQCDGMEFLRYIQFLARHWEVLIKHLANNSEGIEGRVIDIEWGIGLYHEQLGKDEINALFKLLDKCAESTFFATRVAYSLLERYNDIDRTNYNFVIESLIAMNNKRLNYVYTQEDLAIIFSMVTHKGADLLSETQQQELRKTAYQILLRSADKDGENNSFAKLLLTYMRLNSIGCQNQEGKAKNDLNNISNWSPIKVNSYTESDVIMELMHRVGNNDKYDNIESIMRYIKLIHNLFNDPTCIMMRRHKYALPDILSGLGVCYLQLMKSNSSYSQLQLVQSSSEYMAKALLYITTSHAKDSHILECISENLCASVLHIISSNSLNNIKLKSIKGKQALCELDRILRIFEGVVTKNRVIRQTVRDAIQNLTDNLSQSRATLNKQSYDEIIQKIQNLENKLNELETTNHNLPITTSNDNNNSLYHGLRGELNGNIISSDLDYQNRHSILDADDVWGMGVANFLQYSNQGNIFTNEFDVYTYLNIFYFSKQPEHFLKNKQLIRAGTLTGFIRELSEVVQNNEVDLDPLIAAQIICDDINQRESTPRVRINALINIDENTAKICGIPQVININGGLAEDVKCVNIVFTPATSNSGKLSSGCYHRVIAPSEAVAVITLKSKKKKKKVSRVGQVDVANPSTKIGPFHNQLSTQLTKIEDEYIKVGNDTFNGNCGVRALQVALNSPTDMTQLRMDVVQRSGIVIQLGQGNGGNTLSNLQVRKLIIKFFADDFAAFKSFFSFNSTLYEEFKLEDCTEWHEVSESFWQCVCNDGLLSMGINLHSDHEASNYAEYIRKVSAAQEWLTYNEMAIYLAGNGYHLKNRILHSDGVVFEFENNLNNRIYIGNDNEESTEQGVMSGSHWFCLKRKPNARVVESGDGCSSSKLQFRRDDEDPDSGVGPNSPNVAYLNMVSRVRGIPHNSSAGATGEGNHSGTGGLAKESVSKTFLNTSEMDKAKTFFFRYFTQKRMFKKISEILGEIDIEYQDMHGVGLTDNQRSYIEYLIRLQRPRIGRENTNVSTVLESVNNSISNNINDWPQSRDGVTEISSQSTISNPVTTLVAENNLNDIKQRFQANLTPKVKCTGLSNWYYNCCSVEEMIDLYYNSSNNSFTRNALNYNIFKHIHKNITTTNQFNQRLSFLLDRNYLPVTIIQHLFAANCENQYEISTDNMNKLLNLITNSPNKSQIFLLQCLCGNLEKYKPNEKNSIDTIKALIYKLQKSKLKKFLTKFSLKKSSKKPKESHLIPSFDSLQGYVEEANKTRGQISENRRIVDNICANPELAEDVIKLCTSEFGGSILRARVNRLFGENVDITFRDFTLIDILSNDANVRILLSDVGYINAATITAQELHSVRAILYLEILSTSMLGQSELRQLINLNYCNIQEILLIDPQDFLSSDVYEKADNEELERLNNFAKIEGAKQDLRRLHLPQHLLTTKGLTEEEELMWLKSSDRFKRYVSSHEDIVSHQRAIGDTHASVRNNIKAYVKSGGILGDAGLQVKQVIINRNILEHDSISEVNKLNELNLRMTECQQQIEQTAELIKQNLLNIKQKESLVDTLISSATENVDSAIKIKQELRNTVLKIQHRFQELEETSTNSVSVETKPVHILPTSNSGGGNIRTLSDYIVRDNTPINSSNNIVYNSNHVPVGASTVVISILSSIAQIDKVPKNQSGPSQNNVTNGSILKPVVAAEVRAYREERLKQIEENNNALLWWGQFTGQVKCIL